MMAKKLCGAKTRNGKTCQRAPMENGRCYLHGGATPSGPDNKNFKHGRYATVFQGKLAEKFQVATADSNPLDLLPELAVSRALLAQYIETLSAKRRVTGYDLQNVSMLANDVVRTAVQITKLRNDTALTLTEIKFIQAGMLRLLEKYVTDPDQRRSFIHELRQLVPGPDGTEDREHADIPVSAAAAE